MGPEKIFRWLALALFYTQFRLYMVQKVYMNSTVCILVEGSFGVFSATVYKLMKQKEQHK